jgi:hypothetical protein
MPLALPKLRGLLVLLFMILLTPGRASADGKQTARDAFQAGVRAFQAGDYGGALTRFQEADAAAHAPAITYNLARALEKLERPQDALEAYEAYLVETSEGGEFTSSAIVAISQIKARATRLSIESTPSGAEITLDGKKLSTKTPVALLVSRGSHQISLRLDDWNETRTYDAPGGGASGELVFVRSMAAPPPPIAPAKAAPKVLVPPPPPAPQLQGLVISAGISLSAYRFIGTADESSGGGQKTADSAAGGLVFGLALDAGYAVTPRTALLLRLFGGLGSSHQALATIGAGGPVISHHLSDRWWVGGGLAVGAGRADADATTQESDALLDSQITFKTNFALGPTLEVGYVLDQNDDGHWLVALMPTLLVTTSSRESTLFVPLVLGYRWY